MEILVISAGTGVFNVAADLSAVTKHRVWDIGVGISVVSSTVEFSRGCFSSCLLRISDFTQSTSDAQNTVIHLSMLRVRSLDDFHPPPILI